MVGDKGEKIGKTKPSTLSDTPANQMNKADLNEIANAVWVLIKSELRKEFTSMRVDIRTELKEE